jgi:hypothetical protein
VSNVAAPAGSSPLSQVYSILIAAARHPPKLVPSNLNSYVLDEVSRIPAALIYAVLPMLAVS